MAKLLWCIGCKQSKPIEDVPIYGGPGPMRHRGVCRECCKSHQILEKFHADSLYFRDSEARIEKFLDENPVPF